MLPCKRFRYSGIDLQLRTTLSLESDPKYLLELPVSGGFLPRTVTFPMSSMDKLFDVRRRGFGHRVASES